MAEIALDLIAWALTHWFELIVIFLLLSISRSLAALFQVCRYIAAAVSEDYRDLLREEKFVKAVRGK